MKEFKFEMIDALLGITFSVLCFCLILFFLFSCGSYPIDKYHPTLVDIKNQKGHVYNTERIKPKPQCGQRSYQFKYAQSIPLSQLAGYYCFKNEEVTMALRDFDEAEYEDCQKMKEVQNKTR